MRCLVAAAACAMAVHGAAARAETLEPLAVRYDVEMKQDEQAALCHMIVLLANFPRSPEAVKFTLTVAASKTTRQIFVGFIIDVGDMASNAGLPGGITKAWLSTAAFYSNTFNSPGRLFGGPTDDGGVQMATADPATAAALAGAVYTGNYTVEFTRQNAPESRSYHIIEAPSADVLNRFQQCYGEMAKFIGNDGS